MSATIARVAVRYEQIATRVTRIIAMSSGRLPRLFATAMRGTETAATAEPARMKGVLLPRRERQRSERMPNQGSRKSPKMLSSAITTPVSQLERPKVWVSILGTKPSKTCQNEIIPMKGREAIAQRFQSKGIFCLGVAPDSFSAILAPLVWARRRAARRAMVAFLMPSAGQAPEQTPRRTLHRACSRQPECARWRCG